MFKKLFGFGRSSKKNAEIETGVDLEMNYCPKCDEEYRAGIKECVHCEVPLVSGQLKHKALKAQAIVSSHRLMEINPSDSLVTLEKGPMKDMKQLKRILEKKRIPAILASDGPGGG